MSQRKFSAFGALATAFVLTGSVGAAAAANLTDLGVVPLTSMNSSSATLSGPVHVGGISVNNSGWVGGTRHDGASVQAIVMRPDTYSVSSVGLTQSFGWGINNSGQVAGWRQLSGSNQAFVYDTATGTNQIVGSSVTSELAYAINDSGVAAGAVSPASGTVHAATFIGNRTTDLGALANISTVVGLAINASGSVAGYGMGSNSQYHAVVYTAANGLTDLGDVFGQTKAYATGINGAGEVVGSAQFKLTGVSGDVTRAFKWINGTATELGSLYANGNSLAYGIDAAGDIVGMSEAAGSSSPHAFIYKAGQLIDLNTYLPAASGWTLQTAEHISDNGRFIVGAGTYNNTQRAFVLDLAPIPEPDTYLLMFAGLACVGWVARRRYSV